MRLGRRSALMTQVDWSHLRGETLFTTPGGGIVGPLSMGRFDSPYEALGIGAAWPFSTRMDFDAQGRLEILHPNFQNIQFVGVGAGHAAAWWGWDLPGGGGGTYLNAGAVYPPDMGFNFAPGGRAMTAAQITVSGGSASMIGNQHYLYGHVRDYMRPPEVGSLNALMISLGIMVSFRLGEDGHVRVFYAVDDTPSGWHPALAAALGLSGSETGAFYASSPDGGYRLLRAERAMPGVWVPSRPVDTLYNGRGWWGEAHRLNSGRIATSTHSSKRLLSLNLWLDGPADKVNLEDHFLDLWAPMAHPGAKITFWPDWISRREFSRWRRAEGSDSDFWAEWPDVGSLSARPCRRAPIALSLTEAEG